MNRQINIRRLLAVFLIAGLALAPLSRPVMAGTASDASMSMAADIRNGGRNGKRRVVLPDQSSDADRLRQMRIHCGLHD